jgi:hypothetical protein
LNLSDLVFQNTVNSNAMNSKSRPAIRRRDALKDEHRPVPKASRSAREPIYASRKGLAKIRTDGYGNTVVGRAIEDQQRVLANRTNVDDGSEFAWPASLAAKNAPPLTVTVEYLDSRHVWDRNVPILEPDAPHVGIVRMQLGGWIIPNSADVDPWLVSHAKCCGRSRSR